MMPDRNRTWLIALPILGFLLLDLSLIPMLQFISPLLSACIAGILVAQVTIFAFVAAFAGRCWLVGIVLSTLLVTSAIGAFFLSQKLQLGTFVFEEKSSISMLLPVPVVVLFAAMPLLAMRIALGWRIAQMPFLPSQRNAIGVEELFLVTTTIAALLIMAQVPALIVDVPPFSFLLSLGFVALVLCLLNLVATLPAVYLLYRSRHRRLGWLFTIVLATALGVAIAWMSGFLSRNSLMDVGQWSIVLFGCLCGWSIAALSHGCIQFAGYRLVRFEDRMASDIHSSDLERKQNRTLHRRLTAVFILTAIASSFAGMLSQNRRFRDDQQQYALYQELKLSGGAIDVNAKGVYKATLGNTTTDGSIASWSTLYGVTELSLANTQITNAGLAQLKPFTELQSLDLTGCAIDDDGLKQLQSIARNRPNLHRFSFAKTAVTPNGIRDLIRQWPRSISSLDLSDLGLTDDDLTDFTQTSFQVRSLVLAGNKEITDKVFFTLKKSYLHELDLSRTSVNGSGISNPVSFSKLKLQDVPLTDATFGPNIANLTIHHTLTISNTQLTKAILPILGNCTSIDGYEFGDGLILEADLPALGMGINRLSLTSNQFTGACFEDWQPAVYFLSLSGSGLTDATLSSITKLATAHLLDFSDTALTDGCLPTLSKIESGVVNIGNTHITADGLLSSPVSSDLQFNVGLGQFTPEELKRLRQKFRVSVGKPEYEW